jgi:HAD superfamily hydrolase (TIGR01450 family)
MFKNIKLVIFDLDGTIYLGNKLIDGAKEVINHLRKAGKDICFLTNNSTKMRVQIFEKLKRLGIDCTIDEVFTSGYVATIYLKKNKIENVYVCGSDDLKQEFEKAGISLSAEQDAKNLFIGYDALFNYEKLTKAFHVAKKASNIIAANMDASYPGEDGVLYPGCAAMVGAVEYSIGRKVDVVIGKPNTRILEIISLQYKVKNNEILMIGDNYETDILMAKRNNSPAILIGDNREETVCMQNISQLLNINL